MICWLDAPEVMSAMIVNSRSVRSLQILEGCLTAARGLKNAVAVTGSSTLRLVVAKTNQSQADSSVAADFRAFRLR